MIPQKTTGLDLHIVNMRVVDNSFSMEFRASNRDEVVVMCYVIFRMLKGFGADNIDKNFCNILFEKFMATFMDAKMQNVLLRQDEVCFFYSIPFGTGEEVVKAAVFGKAI